MRFFRLLARRSGRIFAIVILVGAILGFGHFMTPRHNALAKVYMDLGDALQAPGVPKFMETEVEEGEVQEVFLNGNTLYYTLYRTDKPVDQLLDYYENLYKAPERVHAPEVAREAILKTVKDKASRDEQRRRIEETEKILNQRFIKFSGKGWGGFSTIAGADPSDPNYTNDMIERFRNFKKTGLARELGDPKIVVAFEDPAQDNTQYFNVWPGADFDHKNIAPRNEEDAPGYDIDDVPRPRGSLRQITFAQEHKGVGFEILAYKHRGSADSALADWYDDMASSGWAVSPTFEEGKTRTEVPVSAALFVKEDREAYVSIRSHEGNEVTSTVVVRAR